MKPTKQCAAAAAKANRILGQLARAVRWRDRVTFPKLYMTHVRPVLEYAVTVWSPYLAQDRDVLEKVQRRMVNMIPGLRGNYEEKLRELGMTTLQRRRERGDMIQTWRILTGKDRVDPAIWFRLQEDQVREGATSTRRHQGYHALLPRTPARLEVRRNFFSNRVVESEHFENLCKRFLKFKRNWKSIEPKESILSCATSEDTLIQAFAVDDKYLLCGVGYDDDGLPLSLQVWNLDTSDCVTV